MPEQSALKDLVQAMLNANGDFSRIPASTRSKKLTFYVKESYPHFLVTDNFYYTSVYFTKKALDDFRSRSNDHVVDLKSKVISITDWSLELSRVDSSNSANFTSYGGIEARLIARAFSVQNKGGANVVLSRHPGNLYRDADVKTAIQNFTHGQIVAAANNAKAALPDISNFKSNANVNGGVVAAATAWSFKEGKTATVSMGNIFKEERGADAYKRAHQSNSSSGGARVTGGAKSSKKPAKKAAGNVVAALNRSSGAAKKSVAHKGKTSMATPGSTAKGTANIRSMSQFKKMVSKIKSRY